MMLHTAQPRKPTFIWRQQLVETARCVGERNSVKIFLCLTFKQETRLPQRQRASAVIIRCSTSFKVIDLSTNRKSVCNFLLMYRLTYLAPFCSYRAAVKLSLTRSFSVISAITVVNHILPRTRFSGLHFCRRQYESNLNQFDVVSFKT